MGQVNNIAGRTYGRLTVEAFVGLTPRRQAVWKALCSCGVEVVVRYQELAAGDTQSCGCLQADVCRQKAKDRVAKMKEQ